MNISAQGLDLIKSFESLRLRLYNCPAGDATIGYGHLVHLGLICGAPSEALFQHGITEGQALVLLRQDVAWAEQEVTQHVKVPLLQGQFDALVSWVFNVGVGSLERSSLLRLLNMGGSAVVPSQLLKWVYAAGVKEPGLVRRREAEIELWEQAA
jgi:lysozyme